MAAPVITFTLPPLPSTNEAILSARGNKFKAAKETEHWRLCGKLTAMNALATLGLEPPMLIRARVVMTSWPKDRRRDTINLWFKSALDGFQDCGIFANDRGIEELTIRFGGVDKVMPRVEVEIYEVTE